MRIPARSQRPSGEGALRATSPLVLALAIAGIAAGGTTWFAGAPRAAQLLWAATTLLCLLPLALDVVRELARGAPAST